MWKIDGLSKVLAVVMMRSKVCMSVGWDGDMLSKMEAGKKRGKGNILRIKWIVDVNGIIACSNKFVGSGRDISAKR